METRLVPSVVQVHAGADLQAAINQAQPGDQLVLDAGATFAGPITLPAKTGDQWITIQSSALDHLPAAGQRVGPEDASFMPKITSPGQGYPALATAPGAHNYRIVGVEFLPVNKDAFLYDLIDLGDGSSAQNSLSQVPHDLTLDQCYVHTWLDQPLKRGIALNSASTNIVNSYIAGFKVDGQDSQAIGGWNGPGPFKIDNNYVEAAGENIMFGGAPTSISGLIPSDIEIRDNLVSKPVAWNGNDPSTYAGKHYSVKNLLELKNAQRVTIDGNRFEHNWADAQVGFAIVFTPRGDQSGGSWVTVSNVSFTNNVVDGTAQGINILGSDDYSASQPAKNIVIQNNLLTDLGSDRWGQGAGGRIFQLLDGQNGGSQNVTIDHNTVTSGSTTIMADGPQSGFVFTNNIVPNGAYGVFGNGIGSGNAALKADFPGATFVGNIMVGADGRYYPANNYFPASWSDVGFVNFTGGDYHLAASSPYKGKATNGTDIGANVDALATAGGATGGSSNGATANSFTVAGFGSSVTAGTTSTFTVTAIDSNGNTVPGYRGTVHFSSSDSQAALPGDYTFTAADNGVHTFSATLKTAGTRSLTATDSTTSISGSRTAITVNPAAASALHLSAFPSSAAAGTAISFTLTATDLYGNTATGYRGTVHFSSSDHQGVLPGDYTFTAADNGTHTFSATLKTAGTASLTVTDTATSSLSSTQTGIAVKAAVASGLAFSGFPSSVTAGDATSFSVTAVDAYGNTATDYRDTVGFSSNDSQAVLPGNYTFTAADNGVHTFSATLKTAGARSLTATDTTSTSIKGTETTITVNGGQGNSVPNVTYHGGPLLQHVQIESVYYGQAWGSDGGLQQQISQVDGFLQYFTNSPYMDVLGQYNVGHGTFVDHDIVAQDPSGGKTVDDRQIQALLNAEITAQHVGAPTSDRFYILFTAPGVTVTADGTTSAKNFAGYHSAFTDSAGATVYYAVVPYPTGTISHQSLTVFQQDTIILSHEVSEGVTDPDAQTGWFDAKQGEIGDIAEGQFGALHGYTVQGVWSQADGKVVIPADTSSTTVRVTGTELRAKAGDVLTGIVATITGADAKATTASFTATIDWGNGAVNAGTITVDSKGGFDVQGSNTYAQAGTYTVTVTVRDQNDTAVGKALTKVSVAPAPPTVDAHGKELWATSGKEFSGVVATFTDTRATAAVGDFTVTINWGDGTTSAGTVTSNASDGFDVNGTHSYVNAPKNWAGLPFGGTRLSASQFFLIRVSIHDDPANSTATAVSIAKVAGTSTNTIRNTQSAQATNSGIRTSNGGRTGAPAAITVSSGSTSRLSVTGFVSSVATANTRSATVATAAPKKLQATTSQVGVGAASARASLPPGLYGPGSPGSSASTAVVAFASAPAALETNGNPSYGTLPEQSPAFGLPLEQGLTDSGALFWLDEKLRDGSPELIG